MFGESHCGSDENRTWITKAHYPLSFTGLEPKFKTNKVICLLRNPIDNGVSYALLGATVSHNLVPRVPIQEQFPQDWDTIVKSGVRSMQQYVSLVRDNISKKIPTLIVRYEDLVVEPEKTLTQIFQFILDAPSL